MSILRVILYLVIYFAFTGALFRLYKKADYEYAWFAFVPILNIVGQLRVIGKSGWNVLWLLLPFANIVFMILWLVAFLQTFGKSGWWVLLAYIPVLNIGFAIMFLIWGYGSTTEFKGVPAWVAKWKPLSQTDNIDSSDFYDMSDNNF